MPFLSTASHSSVSFRNSITFTFNAEILSSAYAIIYNRETDTIETIALAEKHTLWENIKRLAEDTEAEYEEKVKIIVTVTTFI